MLTQNEAPEKVTQTTEPTEHILLNKFHTDTGYAPDELEITTPAGKGDFRPFTTKVFYPKGDDVVIPYFDLMGNPIQFQNGSGKIRNLERIRWAKPEDHKDKNGKPMKYYQPAGSGSNLYYPPHIINMYKDNDQTNVLYLVEGEKKALAGCKKLGLPFIGIPGIYGLEEKQEKTLSKDLKNLVDKLGIKWFVLVFDADALQSKYDHNDPEKDLYVRAAAFFRAVSLFKELITPLSIDLLLAVINPNIENQAKGLDDLLLVEDHEHVRNEFTDFTTGLKKFSIWHNVTGQSDTRLREFFGLNNVETFYDLHKAELKDQTFTLKRIKYRHNGEKLEIIKDNNNDVFWKAEKDKDGLTKGCKIIYRKFIHFLNDRGFKRYDLNSDAFTFIHVDNNVIKELSETKIQDYVKEYIETLPNERLAQDITKDDLADKIYQNPQIYFSKQKLSLLDNSQLEIQRDTLTTAFICYRNGYVEVTKDGYSLKDYQELDNCIYADQQQQRDFLKGSEEGTFKKFVQNISGYSTNPGRFLALRTMIGYLLHDYHEYKIKAINFTDSRISEDDEGRSGKTLLGKSTQYFRKYLEVSGKDFDHTKSTKYQKASLTTQIVHLNDIKRGFKVEPIYTDITEGIEVDQKYKQPYTIRVKYLLSSNKALQISGGSDVDRFVEFELADYYSAGYGPDKEFKQWFWRYDWPAEEWNAFDNFMLECIRLFLENGILEADSINLEERKLLQETNQEFVDFIESRHKSTSTYYLDKNGEEIVFGVEFNKKQLHQEFLQEFNEFEHDKYIRKQETFTKWLKKYAKYRNLECKERKSGADRYMTFNQRPEN